MRACFHVEESSNEADLDLLNVFGGDNYSVDMSAVDLTLAGLEEAPLDGLEMKLINDPELELQIDKLVFEEAEAAEEELVSVVVHLVHMWGGDLVNECAVGNNESELNHIKQREGELIHI